MKDSKPSGRPKSLHTARSSPAPRRRRAPNHLAKSTRRWFESVAREYDLDESHLRVLEVAATLWDRAVKARRVVERDGCSYNDRFGQPKARPEVGVERDAWAGFLRALRELGLDVPAPDSRGPALPANRPGPGA